MRTYLTVAGLVLFVGSFFLPAYYGLSGYTCAETVFKEMKNIHLIDFQKGLLSQLFQVVTNLFFNFSNLLMMVLPILLLTKFRKRKIPAWLIVVQIVLLLNVLLWPIYHWIDELETLSEIESGYYVWLVSMCLILIASFKTRAWDVKKESQGGVLETIH